MEHKEEEKRNLPEVNKKNPINWGSQPLKNKEDYIFIPN